MAFLSCLVLSFFLHPPSFPLISFFLPLPILYRSHGGLDIYVRTRALIKRPRNKRVVLLCSGATILKEKVKLKITLYSSLFLSCYKKSFSLLLFLSSLSQSCSKFEDITFICRMSLLLLVQDQIRKRGRNYEESDAVQFSHMCTYIVQASLRVGSTFFLIFHRGAKRESDFFLFPMLKFQ